MTHARNSTLKAFIAGPFSPFIFCRAIILPLPRNKTWVTAWQFIFPQIFFCTWCQFGGRDYNFQASPSNKRIEDWMEIKISFTDFHLSETQNSTFFRLHRICSLVTFYRLRFFFGKTEKVNRQIEIREKFSWHWRISNKTNVGKFIVGVRSWEIFNQTDDFKNAISPPQRYLPPKHV